MKEFKINEFISLKLENGRTIIYFTERFDQCKYLLINLSIDEIEEYDKIRSIDEAAEMLDHSLENNNNCEKIKIDPEEEFWGHCSNLQAWFENYYNTSLLHKSLAFPLLQKLTDAGDPLAKRVFKDEIAKRIESQHIPVQAYLIFQRFLVNFTIDELDAFEQFLDFSRLGPYTFFEFQKTKGFVDLRTKWDDAELWEQFFRAIRRKRIEFLSVCKNIHIFEDILAEIVFKSSSLDAKNPKLYKTMDKWF